MYISLYTPGMARRYSIADARSRLPTIVDEAQAGHEVELTRRGRPVAIVVSCQTFERLRGRRPQFRDAYRAFVEQHALDEIGLDEDFPASARDRSAGRKVAL